MLRDVEQADHDYLFAYLMYYACSSGGRKKEQYRIFQQLVFMREFGVKNEHDKDAIDVQFESLMIKIYDDANI